MSKLNPFLILVCAVAVLAGGCSTIKLPLYEGKPADGYPDVQTKNGLAVAAHALTDQQESRKYFGVDLLQANILAVFVRVENRDPSASFIVLKDKTSIRFDQPAGPGPGEALPRSNNASRTMEQVATPFAYATLFVPVAAVVAAPLVLASIKSEINTEVINQHFKDEEFQTVTVGAGASTKGFVYIPLPRQNAPSGVCTFHLEALEPRSQQVIPFDFTLQLPQKSNR